MANNVALGDAGTAGTLGLLAAAEKEDVTTYAAFTVLGHLTAYVAYVRDDALARAYDALADANPDRKDLYNNARAFRLAADCALHAIPQAHIDRSGQLDHQRDLGENIAQDSISKEIEPEPHFTAADSSRPRARALLLDLILLGVALLFLTMADAIQNTLRHLFLIAGAGLFVIALPVLFVAELFPVF